MAVLLCTVVAAWATGAGLMFAFLAWALSSRLPSDRRDWTYAVQASLIWPWSVVSLVAFVRKEGGR